MYKDNSQLRIEDFVFPYGKLDPENDWVKLAQWFPGIRGRYPFGASTLVAFRKRFSEEDLAVILKASVPKAEATKKDDSDDGNDPPNSGTLVLDATCCPADIAYPQDIDLLNQAREKTEKTVDELCSMTGQKKPRMYRKRARRDYLRLSKSKKRNAKAIRSAVRKQLQYIRRDIGYIVELVQKAQNWPRSKQTI